MPFTKHINALGLGTLKLLNFDPFIPEFSKWTLPSLNWGKPIIANQVSVQKQEQNVKQYTVKEIP